MKIEIITTKKKLTKNLLLQLPGAGTAALCGGDVLGYINHPKLAKYMLIDFMDKTFTIKMLPWKKNEYNEKLLELPSNYKSWTIDFDSEEQLDSWLKTYNRCKKEALNTQIFI